MYKNYLISVFVISLLIITLIPISSINAEQVQTKTTILSSSGIIKPNEIIHFNIWTVSGYDPVPIGPVRVINLNHTNEYIDTTILGGEAKVNWTVPSDYIPGKYIFRAVYQGYQNFASSIGQCEIIIDNIDSGTKYSTSISLEANSSVVFKNGSIRFTITLNLYFLYWFDGGFINLKNTNLTGSPTIHTYGPIPYFFPMTNPAIFTYSFDYQLPIFSQVGKNYFVVEFTGSTASQSLPCISTPYSILIKSTGFWLSQTLNQSIAQRDDSIAEINTTILGDYPFGLMLDIYFYLDLNKVSISSKTLSERKSRSLFYFNSSIPLGLLKIYTDLYDSSSGFLYANNTLNLTLVDRSRIVYNQNASEYALNDTIHFDIYVTEEDIWTHPINCFVKLIDITDGNRILAIKETNNDGFVSINYRIPNNATIGDHQFLIITIGSPLYIIDTESLFSVKIIGMTEIDLVYAIEGVNRNSFAELTITVFSGSFVLNEGWISLEFASNNTIIDTKSCIAGQVIYYYIDKSHPIGTSIYQIHYYGSNNFNEALLQFGLTVYSRPNIVSLNKNSSDVMKGNTISFWGKLQDENDQAIVNENITITDITRGALLGIVKTNNEGIAYFEYIITPNIQLGMHTIKFVYLGNHIKFYVSSLVSPSISFTVHPPLSIDLNSNKVFAKSNTVINLSGSSNAKVDLYWQPGSTSWIYIASVTLDNLGRGSFLWQTPYYFGDFTLKADINNDSKYLFTSMYVLPIIHFTGNITGNVNDNFIFNINSTERYQIWIENQMFQDWIDSGSHIYEHYFIDRGIKQIKIISNGTFIVYSEFIKEITVYEEVKISLSVPDETIRGATVFLDGTVYGEISGPIPNINVILELNNSYKGVDSSNNVGMFYFTVNFDSIGYYIVLATVNTDEERYFLKGSSTPSYILVRKSSNDNYPTVEQTNVNVKGYKDSSYLCQIEVLVNDDYKISNVNLFIDSQILFLVSNNGSYLISNEIWLIQGNHSLKIEVYDDSGQKTTYFQEFTIPLKGEQTNGQDTTPTSSSKDLLELAFTGLIFCILIAFGNILIQKKRV